MIGIAIETKKMDGYAASAGSKLISATGHLKLNLQCLSIASLSRPRNWSIP